MSERVNAALRTGTLVGVRDGGVCRYGAIPYAQAPVGELRFAPRSRQTFAANSTPRAPVPSRRNCPRACVAPWATSTPNNPKTACT